MGDTTPPAPYTTRSGRVTRRAVRYEPDPNTVFVDDNADYDSDDEDQASVILGEDSGDESVRESEIDEDTDMSEDEEEEDDDDILSDTSSVIPSDMEEYDENEGDDDVLDWDNLTDQASESELVDTEDEFDDDVEGMTDED